MIRVKQDKSFAVHWISFKCRKNFCGFYLEVLKKANAQKDYQENLCFVDLQKPQNFSHVKLLLFTVYQNIIRLFPDSSAHLLFSKLCWYNRLKPKTTCFINSKCVSAILSRSQPIMLKFLPTMLLSTVQKSQYAS